MLSETDTDEELLPLKKSFVLVGIQHNSGVQEHSTCDKSGVQFDINSETTRKRSQTSIAAHSVSPRSRNDFPTKGRKIVVLLSCWFLHVLNGGCFYGPGVIFVELVREFESPRAQAALVQSVFSAIMTGGGVVFTPFVLKYGFGICLTLATLTAAMGFIVAAWATNLTMVIIFVGVISGLGTSIFYLCGFVAVSLMFGENSGAPLAFITLGGSIGQLLSPYLFEILITDFGWRGTYLIMGAIILNGLLPAIILQTSQNFYFTQPGVEEKPDRRKSNCVFDSSLFKDPLIMTFLCNVFILDLTGLFESWFIVDVMELKGYERGDGAFMLVLIGIGSTISRITAVGLKLILRIPTTTHWIYVCLMIASCHVVVAIITDYWPIYAASLVYGFAFGIIYAQVAVIMLEISGLDRYPRAVGLLNLTFGAADFLCGIVGGLVNDLTGSYNLFLYIATGVAVYVSVASIIMTYYVHKSKAETVRTDQNETTPLISKQ